MNIADIERESSLRILLALHISRKPMTTLDLNATTGLATRATRYGIDELRTLGLIEVTPCNSPLYGECRVEYRLKEPLEAYAEKNVREMCVEADEDGRESAKVAALQSLFAEWFPKTDGWGRLYPQKQPYCILCGKSATAEEAHTVRGEVIHAHAACIEALRRSLEQPEKPVQKAEPMSKSVPIQVSPTPKELHGYMTETYTGLIDRGFSPLEAGELVERIQELLTPAEIAEIVTGR